MENPSLDAPLRGTGSSRRGSQNQTATLTEKRNALAGEPLALSKTAERDNMNIHDTGSVGERLTPDSNSNDQ
jgi:hypothetical protein